MRADTMLPLKSDTGDGEEMSIYTKRGDRGITDMAHVGNISKSDDRIRLMGEADELNSHIDLVKSMLHQSEILQLLERIQKNLGYMSPVQYRLKYSN